MRVSRFRARIPSPTSMLHLSRYPRLRRALAFLGTCAVFVTLSVLHYGSQEPERILIRVKRTHSEDNALNDTYSDELLQSEETELDDQTTVGILDDIPMIFGDMDEEKHSNELERMLMNNIEDTDVGVHFEVLENMDSDKNKKENPKRKGKDRQNITKKEDTAVKTKAKSRKKRQILAADLKKDNQTDISKLVEPHVKQVSKDLSSNRKKKQTQNNRDSENHMVHDGNKNVKSDRNIRYVTKVGQKRSGWIKSLRDKVLTVLDKTSKHIYIF